MALLIKYRELSKNDFEDFMMIYMQMQLKKVGINCSLTNYSHSSMETADISKNDILTNFINNQKNRTSEVGLV